MIGYIKSSSRNLFDQESEEKIVEQKNIGKLNEWNFTPKKYLQTSSRRSLRAEAQSFEPSCFTELDSMAYTKKDLSAEAEVYVPDHLLPVKNFSFPIEVDKIQDFQYIVPEANLYNLKEQVNNIEAVLDQKQENIEKVEENLMEIDEKFGELKKSSDENVENFDVYGKNREDLILHTENTEEIEENTEKTEANTEKTSENSEKNSENSENTNENLPQIKKSSQKPSSHYLIYDSSTITSLYHLFTTDPSFHQLPPNLKFFSSRPLKLINSSKVSIKDSANSFIITWRKSKTIEEEKILNQAKIYQQKFSVSSDEQQLTSKKIRSTLNKLSPNNIEKLSSDLLITCKHSHNNLKQVVSEIFEKAWSEKKYTQMYSDLCKMLKTQMENYTYPHTDQTLLPKTRNYFRYELLCICEQTFLTMNKEQHFLSLQNEQADPEKFKLKTMGSVRFIGELFNVNLISAKLVLGCINTLLNLYESEKNEEKLEGACLLLLTGASSFEKPYLKQATNKVYERLKDIRKLGTSTRTMFKILDVEESRANGWKSINKEVPKKVEDLHAEFYLEQGKA